MPNTSEITASHPYKKIFLAFLVIWLFGWVIGPFLRENIPIYGEIIQVVIDRDIDSSAYMYEESVGSYDGEYYLSDSFKHSGRSDYGVTKFFIAGIVSCFAILAFGWRYIM